MNTERQLRHVDLCSGIGGFSLGFEWAGLSKPILFCDTEKWCREILAKNFPNVPIATDVKELANDPERLVPDCDILTAGYPCQPFSVAGKQKGSEDDRHIWPYIFRIIAQKRPTWCVFENVYGHIALGLDKVLFDLESEGYSTRTFIVPACGVNAPHRRDRLWIIARIVGDTSSNGRNEIGSDKNQRSTFRESEEGGMQEPPGRSSSIPSRPNIVGDTEHDGSLATEIGRINEEDARGSSQGQSQTEQSSGASRSGHDETLSRPNDVAYTDSNDGRDGSSTKSQGRNSRMEHRSGSQRQPIGEPKQTLADSTRLHSDVSDKHSEQSQRQEPQSGNSGSAVNVADSVSTRLQGRAQSGNACSSWEKRNEQSSRRSKLTDGQNWLVEPNVGRVANGVSRRVDRLKGLGNAIVPQIAMNIGLAIKEQKDV